MKTESKLDSLGDITSELVSSMPTPTEGIEDLIASEPKPVESETQPSTDSANPTEKRGRGRPKKVAGDTKTTQNKKPESKLATDTGAPASPVPSPQAALGSVSANLLFTVSIMLGGEEWNPKENEQTAMAKAFEDYYLATGRVDLPPVLGLVAAIGFYAASRFAMPTVRAKTATWWTGVKSWWINRKLKKAGHSDVKASPVNAGDEK